MMFWVPVLLCVPVNAQDLPLREAAVTVTPTALIRRLSRRRVEDRHR